MATLIFGFAAVSLVVVAIQFSCGIAYLEGRKAKVAVPPNGCTEF